jgi:protease PrsW
MIELIIRTLLSFTPVCLFLGSLLYIDSYKLVRLPRLIQLIAGGGIAAVVSYLINQEILLVPGMDRRAYMGIGAPAIEEMVKAIPIVILLMRRRIGFVIDAAVCGFAVGTGFALTENLYYMGAIARTDAAFWLARGFGTAVMHGGATAIAAMLTKAMFQKRERESLALVVPGILAAIAIHAVFNQFIVSPLASALAMIIVLPPLIALVFAQSERYVQSWMGSGFDLDSDLLRAIQSDDFVSSRAGRYLQSLRSHFDGPVVADMLCYLRLHAELSLRAKGILMLRETGLPVPKDIETASKLAEFRYLKNTLGPTGRHALAPLLHRSAHDAWQLQLLEE